MIWDGKRSLIQRTKTTSCQRDELLFQASQHFEETDSGTEAVTETDSPKAVTETDCPEPTPQPSSRRFGPPRSTEDVQLVKFNRVPKKTCANTSWSTNLWREWACNRQGSISKEERESGFLLLGEISAMDRSAICFWLQRFVLEVRKSDGDHYCPESLYQVACGLQRFLRDMNMDVNFFEGYKFSQFRSVLDGELKRLNGTGKYIHKKKAGIITAEMEEVMWEKGLLGDHTPQVLIDTMVYCMGLYFALRSGEEHRRLRYRPSQIELVTTPNGKEFLRYKEDISKNNQAGLKQRKLAPKEVVQYANDENPTRCPVHLYKLYNSRCPCDRPDNALYLAPLIRPKGNCWFKKTPLGHSKLAEVVPKLMKNAGIPGYFTNCYN